MDNIKYENWEGIIPNIISLNQKQIELLQKKICLKFLFEKKCDFLDLYKQYIMNNEKILNKNQFTVQKTITQLLLSYLNISKEELLYLDWDGFKNVDEITVKDFLDNFENIWYESSDDLTIYDENAEWIISIYHFGVVSFTLCPSLLRCKKYNKDKVIT